MSNSDTDTDNNTDTDSATVAKDDDYTDPLDPGQVSEEELENQEWTLGEQKVDIIKECGMKWKLAAPNDDEVLDELIQLLQFNQGATEALKRWAQEYIVAPEITDEKWHDDMTATERKKIGNMVLEFSEFITDEDMAQAMDQMKQEQNARR